MAKRRGVLRGTASAWREGGPTLILSRLARRSAQKLQSLAERVDIAAAARRISRFEPATIDEAIEYAERFDYAGISIRPAQIRSEIRDFLQLLASDPPRTVLEIGTGRGGTLFLFARCAEDDALIISMDSPEGSPRFGGRPAYRRRGRLYRSLGLRGQRIVFLPANSHAKQTLTRLENILGGRSLDLLFIDGDHSSEGVEADFHMYSDLVRSGGLIALHDIVPGTPESVGGVPRFWQKVRTADCVEIVEDWSQGGYGIGVLRR